MVLYLRKYGILKKCAFAFVSCVTVLICARGTGTLEKEAGFQPTPVDPCRSSGDRQTHAVWWPLDCIAGLWAELVRASLDFF
jgi:hypothetical protein